MVADQQEIYRKSISLLLKLQADFSVCGEAATGRELTDKLKKGSCHVILSDNPMPLDDGRTALGVIRSRFPEIKVLMFSSELNIVKLSEYMEQGAAGCVPKSCDTNTLFKAIRTVYKVGHYFDNSVSDAMLYRLKVKTTATTSNDTFTSREMDIVRKVCEGLSNKQIASCLNISPSTVDFHKGRIYAKTSCSNASELLRYSIKRGLIQV